MKLETLLAAASLLVASLPVQAIGPHELLVLANANEPDSVAIAEAYLEMRRIPEVNLIKLDLGATMPQENTAISHADFTRYIWQPAIEAMQARGIAEHILAWAYSTHFPFRIASSPAVSLQGLTFTRNRMPDAKAITEGTYASPLFAGPNGPNGHGFSPQSFESARELLREKMPLPTMTLGYTGPHGNTTAEVLQMLARGVQSDSTAPQGTVYFVTRDDVRSRARQWQFSSAALGLRRMGVNAEITDDFPETAENIIGIMTGSPDVFPERYGTFLPGAMADHLTSFAAAFDNAHQSKLSRWITAGVTGTAGAVTEPMSYWTKFPNARFFNHYRMGCTMIESFYQSIRAPLQIMLVGEPLAAPWAPAATLKVAGLEAGDLLEAPRPIDLHIRSARGTHYRRFLYLINGRVVGEGTSFVLDPEGLAPGTHEFRAVAYQVGFVRSQVFDTVRFEIR